MTSAYQPNYYQIDVIYLKELVFEKSIYVTNVSIFGYYLNPTEDILLRVDYFCDFSMLTDILIAAKDDGEPIINAITEKLNNAEEEYPLVIDVENLFGGPLKVEEIVLTIYKPMVEDENGVIREENDNCYIIERVEPKPISVNCKSIPNAFEQELDHCFQLLEGRYQYYLILLRFGNYEKIALKKSGLKNKLLFKMAELKHRLIKK